MATAARSGDVEGAARRSYRTLLAGNQSSTRFTSGDMVRLVQYELLKDCPFSGSIEISLGSGQRSI